MTDKDLRATHVADQTNAHATAAAMDAYRAIRSGANPEEARAAFLDFAAASFNAGWDQCYADIAAHLARLGIDIPDLEMFR